MKSKITIMDNGLKIIYIMIPNSNLVSVKLQTNIGEDQEEFKSKEYEIVHTLEHLFSFFTSKKYPNGNNNLKKMELKGIESDASVNEYKTVYSLKSSKKNLNSILDIIYNTFNDFKIDRKIFSDEKKAIEQELNDLINDIWFNLETNINKHIYPKHIRSISQKDKKKNLKNITEKSIYNFYNKYYSTSNSIMTICGDFKMKDIDFEIINNFSKIEPKKIFLTEKKKISFKPNISFTQTQSVSFNLYFYFKINKSLFDNDYFTLSQITKILTDGLESRLYKSLRGKGLVYSIFSEIDLHPNNKELGYFIINTQGDNKNLLKIIEVILKELKKIKNRPIQDNEIVKITNNFENEYYEELNNNKIKLYSNLITKYISWDKHPESLETIYRKYKNIDKTKIKNTCKNIFNKNNLLIGYGCKKNINNQIFDLLNKFDL